MLQRPARILLLAGAAFVLLLVAGGAVSELYTDALWFGGLGYERAFWTRLGVIAGVRITTATVGAALVMTNLWMVARHVGPVQLRRRYGNLEIAEQVPRRYVLVLMVVVAILAGWWLSGLQFGGNAALAVLAWLRHVDWGVVDPLFQRDLGFYVFSLPVFFRATDFMLLATIWSILLVVLGYVLVGAVRWREGRVEIEDTARVHLVVAFAALVLLLGLRYWLGRYDLLVNGTGIGGSLGYTDVRARLPAHRIMTLFSVIAAGALLYGAWRRTWLPPLLALGGLVVGSLLVGRLYPSLIQKFQVEPNQLATEAPFIRWNMDFTRRAYGLHDLERRAFPYRLTETPQWAALAPSLSKLPLWDPEPLRTTYNEVQAIYGWYAFPDVDFDRYGPPGDPQQVAIAVREFDVQGLPETARTWQTLHLNPQYLRGMGAVVTPAAETAGDGEPLLWIRNVEPVERSPAAPAMLELTQPSVYFGETTGGYAVLIPGRDSAFLGTPGRDFPAGVRLSSFPRLLAFAWRFREKNLLFAGELSDESRFVFRRDLAERVRTLAPFILWDQDAYPIVSNGRLLWIVDGYTVSATFPLARAVQFEEVGRFNYLSSSVKATVDAVTGEVIFYALDSPDPILQSYRRVFPELIRPFDAMPEDVRRHLRYPSLYLRAQADIIEEYHLEQAEAFYAGQDVWQLPQEEGPAGVPRPYRPTYALMKLPGEEQVEFLLVMPFIARERQNMTAVLVARNDPPHYGELILLELPRDQQIPGPTQIGTMIEQDPAIAQQLSLWRQAGSNVVLGHLRVVPLDSTFLYVEPLFLSAQGSPIPELQRVIVSDGQNVSMAPSLASAVQAMAGRDGVNAPVVVTEPLPTLPLGEDWSRRAFELFEEADSRLRIGDWSGFGERWEALRELLGRLARENR